MLRLVFMLSLALALVLAMPRAAGANLVVNGGFETGLTGWTESGNYVNSGVATSLNGVLPHSGNFQAFFGPVGGLGYISQTLATTAGVRYTFTFWLANPFDLPANNEFYWSLSGVGYSDDLNLPTFQYTEFTNFSFIAPAASTVLTFGFRNDTAYSWFLLDDVSFVGDVPEPSSLAAFGLSGIAVLGLLRRKA